MILNYSVRILKRIISFHVKKKIIGQLSKNLHLHIFAMQIDKKYIIITSGHYSDLHMARE